MKCIYINESGAIERTPLSFAIINAIVVDEDERTEIKSLISEIVISEYGHENKGESLRWTKISPNNVAPYVKMIKLFNRTESLSFDAMVVKKFTNKKRYKVYIALIHSICERIGDEDVRVFIPNKKYAKTIIKTLNKELNALGIECGIFQNLLQESRFLQMANVGGGMLLYYLLEDQYFDKIDQPGKSQLVSQALGMKKKKGKINITHVS